MGSVSQLTYLLSSDAIYQLLDSQSELTVRACDTFRLFWVGPTHNGQSRRNPAVEYVAP